MILTIVGGAAGVGKTSLLNAISDLRKLNTGTFFKSRMRIDKRDNIRKGDWSRYEEDVVNDLLDSIILFFDQNKDVVLDTHFAAKIYNKEYRIGLKEKFLFFLGKSLFLKIKDDDKKLLINVVLITTCPHSLLRRRRLDKTRDRELIPSDCFNGLRNNDIYSRRYSHELSRAKTIIEEQGIVNVKYYVIQNDKFDLATRELTNIIRDIKNE